jgi:hypothetical protein
MNPVLHIKERDREVLEALVYRIRTFSQRQLADHFWNGSLPNTRRRMKSLAENGLVERLIVQARLTPKLTSPIATWQPGEPTPDFGSIAHVCQQRWKRRPTQACVVWIATEKAAQLFGGVRRGELKNPIQATHDLGVAAVWLRQREIAPRFAKAWRGEDLRAHTRRGEKLPDAFIEDEEGKVTWVIEFGGGYDTERVQDFHDDCASRGLPYQLW